MLGTGPFAVPTLRRLAAAQHEIVCVATRPPRGRRAEKPPMQAAAEELGISVWQPETVNDEAAVAELRRLQPELVVVCDYGEILKPEVLAVAPLGAINLHGSLLPKYRGAAPVQWAVLNGDAETGNTVFQITPGLDAGPILGSDRIAIDPDETAGQLEARLAQRGGELVLSVIEQLVAGNARPIQQDRSQASKAPRLQKEHGQIDWSRPAVSINNQVRGLDPWPRAYTDWQRAAANPLRLIIHRARVVETPDAGVVPTDPGTILEAGPRLLAAAGDGVLELLTVQPAGKRAMTAAELLRGYPLAVGQQLGSRSDRPAAPGSVWG
ncbi:MAG: methionyl-tRNA formyltransferase [Pirellulales bacterium]|nr:methionyl-tRNA formyltransferase [Pirellulales bacterium]